MARAGWGLHVWPWPVDDPILGLIGARRPDVYAGLQYGYATLWFTTSFLLFNLLLSTLYILSQGGIVR